MLALALKPIFFTFPRTGYSQDHSSAEQDNAEISEADPRKSGCSGNQPPLTASTATNQMKTTAIRFCSGALCSGFTIHKVGGVPLDEAASDWRGSRRRIGRVCNGIIYRPVDLSDPNLTKKIAEESKIDPQR